MPHLMAEACCTCATLLGNVTPLYDEKTEKPVALDRRLDCCGRVICGTCIHNNARFSSYCPFCQVTTAPSPLPQGLRNTRYTTPPPAPPSYHSNKNTDDDNEDAEALPPYSSLAPSSTLQLPEKSNTPAVNDVLHFLNHQTDTLTSLSLRYGVPLTALRRANNITSDHLLSARRTVLIPGEFYKGGVSLSPRPVEGEEEEVRKGKVRRFMVTTKVSEYDVAVLYVKEAEYDVDAAIEALQDDERWERDHPLEANAKGKGKMKHDAGRRRFTGQRS